MKKYILSSAILSLFATVVFAQQPLPQQPQQEVKTDYSDDEIETFVDANLEITKVQQKAKQEAVGIIKDNNLELDRFNEIVAIQQGKSDEEASAEELENFNAAAQKLMANNKKTQSKMMAALDNHGMSQQDYQQIMMAYQQDEDFRKKIDGLVQKKSKG